MEYYEAPHFALVPVSTGQSTSEPVATTDLRDHLRLGTSSEDSLLASKIAVARKRLEGRLSRSFLHGQFDYMIDAFPGDSCPIALPRVPAVSVESVTWYDTTDGANTFSSTAYFLDTYSQPGRLCLKTGQVWPTGTRDRVAGVIRFTAGHSSAASGVPDPLVEAVKKLATELYENREASSLGNSVNEPLPHGIEELIEEYVLVEVG